jgi:hypothetical protein
VKDALEIQGLLERIAQRFESSADTWPQKEPSETFRGWGQFLDAPKVHKQIGLYGTAAGVLVLSAASRGRSQLSTDAAKLLTYWWQNKDEPDPRNYGYEKLIQTLRVSFVALALRLSDVPEAAKAAAEAVNWLLSAVLSSGLWGNYWTSAQEHDETPRLYVSALVLLCCNLLLPASSPVDGRFTRAAQVLEEKLSAQKDLTLRERAAIAAALLCSPIRLSRKLKARVREIAFAPWAAINEGGVYFYDYELQKDGNTAFGRDYFIVPTDMLIGIAGFQQRAPAALRLRAEKIVSRLSENLEANGGVFRLGSEKVTTKNQAWAALMLRTAHEAIGRGFGLRRPLAWVAYQMRRERTGNRFTEVWFPFFSMAVIALFGVLLRDQGGLTAGAVALSALFVGGLYGPEVVRRIFPGYR